MTSPEHQDRRDGEVEEPPIRFTDKRKVDRTAEPEAADTPPSGPAAAEPVTDENMQLLEERTADLQRLQAEYANYRRRAERDRLAASELATGRVLAELVPVLDDLDRARTHGDLEGGPLKAVADKLEATLTKLGLERFGEVGDEFDPSIHEAVLHDESDAVEVPTTTTIMRPGYRHHERLLRAAMVGVSDPIALTIKSTESTESTGSSKASDAAEPAEEPAASDDEQ